MMQLNWNVIIQVYLKQVSGLNRHKIKMTDNEKPTSAVNINFTFETFKVVSFGVPPVLFDACQQGLKPTDSTLTVSVQEGDDLAFGGSCPPQPGSDQTWTLLHPQDPHRHLQSPHVVLQLLLQEVWSKTAHTFNKGALAEWFIQSSISSEIK